MAIAMPFSILALAGTRIHADARGTDVDQRVRLELLIAQRSGHRQRLLADADRLRVLAGHHQRAGHVAEHLALCAGRR